MAPIVNETLKGSRLILRPFTEIDITPTYLSWLNDPLVVQYSNQRFFQHDELSCRKYLSNFKNSPSAFLAVVHIATNKVIGTMTVFYSPYHDTADIGIMLGERSIWGKGFGKECFSLVVTKLIDGLGVRKITAGCLSSNKGMIEVMKYSGLHLEATRYGQEMILGKPEDILYYARFHEA